MTRTWLVSVVMLVGLVGCGSSAMDDTADDDPRNGDIGDDPVDEACGQPCQDQMTSWNLISTVWFLHNQNLAGSPVGNQDRTGSCPQGGTFHITGSTGYDASNNIGTTHLVYDLSGCRYVSTTTDLSVDVTHTGLVQQDGTFNGGGAAIAMTYQSSSLTYAGEIFVSWSDEVTPLSDACPVSLSQSDGATSATICTRTTSY